MMTLGLMTAGIAVVAIWTYLLVARGNFWRVSSIVSKPGAGFSSTTAATPTKVVAIIPARNEADVVARSVTSLLKEDGICRLSIVLVDDGSSDGTADAARAAAERLGKTTELRVLRAQPLPPGWSGKLWALRQGIAQTHELKPDYLLLTDADVVHSADDLNALLAIAQVGGYDLTSVMVRLHCRTFAERVLIPAFVFFFFKLYPPRWIADLRRATAGAAGGCILVRPEALERAGGIEAIRAEVIDDCALARRIKHSGGRVWLGLAAQSASIRPYESWAVIGRMISRNAFNQLRHSSLLLLGVLAGMALTYLVPVALLFSARPLFVALGLAAWAMMTLAYWPMVRYYQMSGVWALSLPAAALFYAGATMHSAVKYWQGQGGEWKGRIQDPAC
jgi:hopene-associated glycosyltransferase HpnB